MTHSPVAVGKIVSLVVLDLIPSMVEMAMTSLSVLTANLDLALLRLIP
jgi:hypothetical protein